MLKAIHNFMRSNGFAGTLDQLRDQEFRNVRR